MPIEDAVMMVLRLKQGINIQEILLSSLPAHWKSYMPESIAVCQSLGSKWFNSKSTDVLKVPSAGSSVTIQLHCPRGLCCYVAVDVQPLEFDPRLWPNPQVSERRPAPEKLTQILRAWPSLSDKNIVQIPEAHRIVGEENEPFSCISRAPRSKAPNAARAKALPTLVLRTPIAERSATLSEPPCNPITTFTGRSMELTRAAMSSLREIPGA